MQSLNEGFIAQLTLLLMPHVKAAHLQVATNVFSAYYMVLTMMLAQRIDGPEQASMLFRELVQAQKGGW